MARVMHLLKSSLASLYWFVTQGQWRIKDVFDNLYEGQTRSESFRKIYRDVFGDDYPEEADPSGFLTMTDLENIARFIGVGEEHTFVDLACGRGGSGLWVARQTGARLMGVDISDVAVEKARRRVADFGLVGRAEFQAGDFAATGFPDASFDGAMSVDSLFLVPDKTGSIHETARILRPGARFCCTTWEANVTTMVKDYRPLLENAGFQIERYEKTPDWERRQRAVYERILAEKDTLIREMGKASAKVWILDAQTELPRLSRMRRILFVARKN